MLKRVILNENNNYHKLKDSESYLFYYRKHVIHEVLNGELK